MRNVLPHREPSIFPSSLHGLHVLHGAMQNIFGAQNPGLSHAVLQCAMLCHVVRAAG